MTKRERMEELIGILGEASKAYYQEDREIMSNYEYDALYDELLALEAELGIQMSASPTRKVGYEVISQLPKERHPRPMLSLDKTKDRDALAAWLGAQEGVLSWKLDGLTVALTYQNGELVKAVTRGNGEIGEIITPNAKTFINLPMKIPFTGELVLRGEAIISYADFERINASLADGEAKYKNPRNLCSGSVRQLNSAVTAQRNVQVKIFTLVSAEGMDFPLVSDELDWVASLGFDVVERELVTADTLQEAIVRFSDAIPNNAFPSDGLVLQYNDRAYGRSLGETVKFPRDSIAFKWADEIAETTLIEISWGPARTGLITPVAVFEPVELEGTTVTRASVHNVSILEELGIAPGDTITVYKANMIIPQIAENLSGKHAVEIPETCPVCGGATRVEERDAVRALYCTNPDCQAKQIKRFAHFTERDALNIQGLSESTLEKLIGAGLIRGFRDIFHLAEHRETIAQLEGLGEKSADKLLVAVETARDTDLAALIYGVGIGGVGLAVARLICRHFDYDEEQIVKADAEELSAIEGIGPVLAESFSGYFADEGNREAFTALAAELRLARPEQQESRLSGKTFVITGSLTAFANRSEAKNRIEAAGGKVAGSVSAKTDYLVNNDVTSTSSKNKKAKELGIPIITEEELLAML